MSIIYLSGLTLLTVLTASGSFVIPHMKGGFKIPHIKLPNLFRRPDLFGRQVYLNVCIYSRDVAQYMPKCFLCPEGAYPSILEACAEVTTAQSNVTFDQARCMEQNCAINYPQDGENVATPMQIGRGSSNSQKITRNGEIVPKFWDFVSHLLAPPSSQILSGPRNSGLKGDGDVNIEAVREGRDLPPRSRPQSFQPSTVTINGTDYTVVDQKLFFAAEA